MAKSMEGIRVSENHKKLMNPFLILTKDLIVRPIVSYDESGITNGIRECLKSLQMWLPWMEEKPDPQDAPKIATKFFNQSKNDEAFHFAIYRNEELMGMCSFYEFDSKGMSAHMGYWCKNDRRNEDYFIDAINALVKYAFHAVGLLQLNISCLVGNFVSEAAAKKLHFKLQGIQLLNQKQIKLFLLTCNTPLPALNVSWITEASQPMFELNEVNEKAVNQEQKDIPQANKRYLDDSF